MRGRLRHDVASHSYIMSLQSRENHGKQHDPRKKNLDRREAKSFEIKRALTHRARLRRSYFKLLDKEGHSTQDNTKIISQDDSSFNKIQEKNPKERGPTGRDDNLHADAHINFQYSSERKDSDAYPYTHPERKPLTFGERSQIAKGRKEAKRAVKLKDIQDRRRLLDLRLKERDLKNSRFNKSTKKGQPLMAPRINTLLDKIRKDL